MTTNPKAMEALMNYTDNTGGTTSNIDELIITLSEQGMSKEADQITLLMEQIKSMEKSYLSVFQELQEVKEQMKGMTNELQGLKEVKTQYSMLEGHEAKAMEQYGLLQSIKDTLNRQAKIILQNFKDLGNRALNNVCTFLGVKETLIKLRDISQSNAVEMRSAAENVEAAGIEVKSTLLHMKNIGSALKGEAKSVPESVESPKIFQSLQRHYEKRMDKYEKRTERLNEAISKVTKLEKAVDKISVREKLAENKALIDAKDATEPKAPVHQKEAAYAR